MSGYRRWGAYAQGSYSDIKKNETLPFPVTGKKLEMITLSEGSETGKDKYHRVSLLVESKHGYKYTSLQKRNSLTDLKRDLGLPKRKGVGVRQ